jgi:hypothetical protein
MTNFASSHHQLAYRSRDYRDSHPRRPRLSQRFGCFTTGSPGRKNIIYQQHMRVS